MNKVAPRAMLLGDLVVIVISALLLAFRSSYEPKLLFDISIAVLPFLLMWTILARIGNAYDLRLSTREFIKRNLLLWLASAALAQISRVAIKYIVSSAIPNALWIAIEAIGISILFIFWKYGSYSLYKVSSNPKKRTAKLVIWSLILAIIVVVIASLIPFTYSLLKYSEHIYVADNSPTVEAALVLGAGVWSDGTPSTAMVERVQAAWDLYEQSKVRYIVLSGSTQEAEVMLQLAESFGLDGTSLALDILGESTLDSCLNVIHDLGFSNIAVISHRYHLYRAMYFCDLLGIQSIGIIADSETQLPETIMRRYLREIFATAVGYIQIQALHLRH